MQKTKIILNIEDTKNIPMIPISHDIKTPNLGVTPRLNDRPTKGEFSGDSNVATAKISNPAEGSCRIPPQSTNADSTDKSSSNEKSRLSGDKSKFSKINEQKSKDASTVHSSDDGKQCCSIG